MKKIIFILAIIGTVTTWAGAEDYPQDYSKDFSIETYIFAREHPETYRGIADRANGIDCNTYGPVIREINLQVNALVTSLAFAAAEDTMKAVIIMHSDFGEFPADDYAMGRVDWIRVVLDLVSLLVEP